LNPQRTVRSSWTDQLIPQKHINPIQKDSSNRFDYPPPTNNAQSGRKLNQGESLGIQAGVFGAVLTQTLFHSTIVFFKQACGISQMKNFHKCNLKTVTINFKLD